MNTHRAHPHRETLEHRNHKVALNVDGVTLDETDRRSRTKLTDPLTPLFSEELLQVQQVVASATVVVIQTRALCAPLYLVHDDHRSQFVVSSDSECDGGLPEPVTERVASARGPAPYPEPDAPTVQCCNQVTLLNHRVERLVLSGLISQCPRESDVGPGWFGSAIGRGWTKLLETVEARDAEPLWRLLEHLE
jgi:hypothetical protein